MEKGKNRKNLGRVTLADVAKKVGVGQMTVSRALRTPEMVSESLRKRIEQVVAELGYVPNSSARQLASAAIQNIVAVTTSITSTENNLILSAFQESIQQSALQLSILSVHNEDWLPQLINYAPQIVVLVNLQCPENIAEWLKKSEIPTIEVGMLQDAPIHINVGIDCALAMKNILLYLINKGHQEIGLISAAPHIGLFKPYLESWRKIMLQHHLNPHLVLHSAQQASFSLGANLLKDAIQDWDRPDALLFLSDELACGALNEAQRRKIVIPRDCAIASLGGLDVGNVSVPTLTTLDIPYEKMGKAAGKILLKLIHDKMLAPQDYIVEFPTKVIERKSA
nr:LacI family DNA-binding transcriptional regulator [uncultured Haemophilus sp.]